MGSEFDMTAHLDKNATLVSVRIYKQLWIEDHYLFYMDVFLFDGKEESRPMKRYTVHLPLFVGFLSAPRKLAVDYPEEI